MFDPIVYSLRDERRHDQLIEQRLRPLKSRMSNNFWGGTTREPVTKGVSSLVSAIPIDGGKDSIDVADLPDKGHRPVIASAIF